MDETRERLVQFYSVHNPQKLSEVECLLDKYDGKEDVLLQRMHLKYGVRDFQSLVAVDDIYEHERYSFLLFSWGSSYPGSFATYMQVFIR